MSEKQTPKKADEWRPIFLETLRQTANVRLSCRTAGVTRAVAYAHKDRAPEFAEAWADALADATDTLEGIARKRAQESSDLLLIFLLKAHRPELYREPRGGFNVNLTAQELASMSDEELDQLHAKLSAPHRG